MRATFEGSVPGPDGPAHVYAKVRRARGLADRAKRRLRSPRGPAEGDLLRALLSRGVAVASPVAWSSADGLDVLVTCAVEGAVPLSEALRGPLPRRRLTALAESVGRL